MAVYSLTQFVSVIILYTIQSNLSDVQFLYIDLFLISVFALFFGHTEPYDGPLPKQPPSASLVSAAPIMSILCHMVSIIVVQVVTFIYVQQQPWFTPYVPQEDVFKSYENYALFSVSTFQYIIMAAVFSMGKPYRKSLLTNHRLLVSLILMTSFTMYLVLWPCSWLVDSFEFLLPPFTFRLTLIGFAFGNLLIAVLIEYGVVNFIVAKKFGHKQANAKKEHVKIEKDLMARSDWPPLVTPTSLRNDDDRLVPGNDGIGRLHVGNLVGGSLRRATIDSTLQYRQGHNRRHSSALTIPIPKPDNCNSLSRPRSQNSSVLTPSSEPHNISSFLNGPLRNSHHDCRIALDIIPNNCKS